MLILGIETSCDETSVSLIEVRKNKLQIISNVVSSQISKHAPFGGVVPSLAAREHVANLSSVTKTAMGNFKIEDIDLISVTAGPGLISSLLVGTAFAKALAYKYKKPIIGINHIEGHISSNWLGPITQDQKSTRPLPSRDQVGKINPPAGRARNQDCPPEIGDSGIFPALCLVVSGGHTSLVFMEKFCKYRLVGETLDDAAGEAFDKIARMLELGYPGGPAISAEAEKFKTHDEKLKVNLPRPMIDSKDLDFSFAGLKTAVLYLIRGLTKKYKLSEIKASVAKEAQAAIVDVLVIKTKRAALRLKARSIMLSGGVSANKLLREKIVELGKNLKIKTFIPQLAYTTDNAAMIALAGYFQFKFKNQPISSLGWQKVKTDANWEIV